MRPTYRTIWISDLHLGMPGCRAEAVLRFLRSTDSEQLYLVGDLVDGWALSRSWHWPPAHNAVIQTILKKAMNGTRVIYVPGNHDEFARQFCGLSFGDIEIVRDTVHQTADGHNLLVLHGDEFDGAVALAPWLSRLGARIYELAIAMNRPLNAVRSVFGRPYWSLSRFLRDNTKRAVQYIAGFETALAQRAAARGTDGVVCGHIHRPQLRMIGEVLYANCGDWIESCSALVEHHDGTLEILHPAQEASPAEGAPGDLRLAVSGDGEAARIPTLAIAR